MKLDIGCGPYKKPGFIGVDLLGEAGVDVVADTTALPFEDSSVEHIHTRNTLEHIPNLFGALREFYRVSRDGGTLEITVPHFSSYEYWRDLTHIRPFSAFTFDHFDRARLRGGTLPDYIPEVDFEITRVVLDWWDPQQVAAKRGWKKGLLKGLNGLINAMANGKLFLCERLWCWWVGGFVLVTFHLKVHKPLRRYA
jgi:SAM-dependent methyltransferase